MHALDGQKSISEFLIHFVKRYLAYFFGQIDLYIKTAETPYELPDHPD